MVKFTEALSETMFKFTNIVMYFAPFAVGAAIAYSVGHMGIGILGSLLKLLATLYVALIFFILFVLVPVALIFKIPLRSFYQGRFRTCLHRLCNHQLGVSPARCHGTHGRIRGAAQDRLVCPAHRIQLQPRRYHAVSFAGNHFYRPGLRHSSFLRQAVADRLHTDAYQQRGGRCSACLAGDPAWHRGKLWSAR